MVDLSTRSIAYAFNEVLLDDRPSVDGTEVEITFDNYYYKQRRDVPYVLVDHRPGQIDTSMDGSAAWETGYTRFECRAGANLGELYLNALCDEIISKFNPGDRIYRGGDPTTPWTITVRSVTRTMGKRLTAWFVASVDVNYHAVRAVT